MNIGSARLIHAGINFVLGGGQSLNPAHYARRFQDALRDAGLDYHTVDIPNDLVLVVIRKHPSPLEFRIASAGPNIGQLMVIAENPLTTFELFEQEAEATVEAFKSVWSSQNRVLLQVDATIRELYETTSEHAFQELWEERLGQPGNALAAFGRPIRGGGLRFVLDPRPPEEPAAVEVKIESYLGDTRKIFVETQFVWPTASSATDNFRATPYLSQLIGYRSRVHQFMSEEGKTNGAQ